MPSRLPLHRSAAISLQRGGGENGTESGSDLGLCYWQRCFFSDLPEITYLSTPIFFWTNDNEYQQRESPKVIDKHRKLVAWKPARVVADLVKTGMDQQQAEVLVKSVTPARKETKAHKPHNSHAKPVNMEDLSTHYIVVGDYDMLSLRHQDALIAAVRCANGKSGRHDGATAVKLFGLVKAYPIITTAEVNKHLNRDAFLDSIPLYIDGVEIPGEPMPSADNDYVKELFGPLSSFAKLRMALRRQVRLSLRSIWSAYRTRKT